MDFPQTPLIQKECSEKEKERSRKDRRKLGEKKKGVTMKE